MLINLNSVRTITLFGFLFGCNEPGNVEDSTPPNVHPDSSDNANQSADSAQDTAEDMECIPREEAPSMPNTASEYADMCEVYLGVTPTIDCGDGAPIPILVDGVEVFEEPNDCDNPDFKGACPVGSRIGRLTGTNTQGEVLEDVVWAYFCRSQGPESLASGIASVQIIGHNTTTGATCFFESADAIGQTGHIDYLRFGEDGYLDGEFPGPDDVGFNDAFIVSDDCSECHQADPFIHTPWVDQARLPEDPSQPVLPTTAGPDSPYWVVAGAQWDLRTVHIEGNGCVECHRAPESNRILVYNQVDVNTFMPPNETGSMNEDAAQIARCYRQGPDRVEGCEWVDPPGAYCEEFEDGSSGGGSGGGGGSSTECPEDFDPSESCTDGDKCTMDGRWYVCEGGEWVVY